MKKLIFLSLMGLNLFVVAAPNKMEACPASMCYTISNEKACAILNLAAVPLSDQAGYSITAGDLIDAYFAGEATIKNAGFDAGIGQMWDVSFGGITLCIIETI